MSRSLRITLTALALSVTSACSMMPDYARPAPLIDIEPAEDASGAQAVADLGWRDFYSDPQLQDLLAIALENNQDLRATALAVEQLRERYRIQRAARLPAIDGEGSARRQRSSEGFIGEQYSIGVALTGWELDFFGRIDSLSEAALQRYFASEAGRNSAQLNLVAEVADAWYSWQASRTQHAIAISTRELRENSLALTQKRFDAGLVSELDLRQAETSLHEARLAETRYLQQSNQDFTALQLLAGQTLDRDRWQADWSDIGRMRDLPAGLSSDVLLQRPDVLQAEHEIRAANADIGAARAAFFPRISLTAALGLSGTAPAQLTDTGGRNWQIGPQFSVPLLDWGVNQANLDVAELEKDINIARYQQVIQQAFKEVRDQMEARTTLDAQLQAQNDLTASTGRSAELAEYRFDAGVDSYLDVLEARRSLLSSQLNMVDIQLLRLRNQITLYKALGGGLLD